MKNQWESLQTEINVIMDKDSLHYTDKTAETDYM